MKRRKVGIFSLLILMMTTYKLSFAVSIKPEQCELPAETIGVGLNGYFPPERGAQVSTGSRDISVVKTILHFPLERLGTKVKKAEFRITKNSVQNISKGRITTEPFPTDIILDYIEGIDYPHDPPGTGNYWRCISSEWGIKPLGSKTLIKAGTKLNNTPITLDVTEWVNNELEKNKKFITFRIWAERSDGDGFFAYLRDPILEIEKNEEEMTEEEKFEKSWKPKAEQIPFTPVYSHPETVQLPCGEKIKILLPPVSPQAGKYIVLRFQTRLIYPARDGWNRYLEIYLNGEPVNVIDKYSVSRLLNRAMVFTHNYGGGTPTSEFLISGNKYMTFFSPDYKIDEHVIDAEQFREGTWFMLRVEDMLYNDKQNILELINIAKPEYFGKKDPKDVIVEVSTLGIGYTPTLMEMNVFKPKEISIKFTPQASIKEKEYQINLTKTGGINIKINNENYYVDSQFSYPNAGFNKFSWEIENTENWEPAVEIQKNSFKVKGENNFYKLERKGNCYPGFIEIFDTFTNKTNEVIGIIVQNRIISNKMPLKVFVEGMPISGDTPPMKCPENPTLFWGLEKSGLGFFAHDTPFRNQLIIEVKGNYALFGTYQLGLSPYETYTLSWRIYTVKDNDYFTFINRLRADLGSNFTIDGPFQFFYDIRDAYTKVTPEYMQARLKKQYVAFAGLSPWFLYADGATLTRQQYAEKMKAAISNLKKCAPNLKLLSQWEPALQAIPIDADLEKWPTADGFVRGEDGKIKVNEHWSRPKGIQLIESYPWVGSNYLSQILKDIDLCMDEIGFDGIYFDCFGFKGQTYDRWDGRTVEIDPKTYTVKRKLCLIPILAGPAQKIMVEHILKKGGIVVNNMFPCAAELEGLPIFSFYEIGADASPIRKGHLWTPIGLSESWYHPRRTGRELVEAVIQRLREGGLFYYYHTLLREEDVEAYQLVEHMYPITIQELHPGWIKGKERIITCVPRNYLWEGDKPPDILIFNPEGKKVNYDKKPVKTKNGWKVDLTFLPKGSVAIIEQIRNFGE